MINIGIYYYNSIICWEVLYLRKKWCFISELFFYLNKQSKKFNSICTWIRFLSEVLITIAISNTVFKFNTTIVIFRFNILFFRLLEKGRDNSLKLTDLPPFGPSSTTKTCMENFEKYWTKEVTRANRYMYIALGYLPYKMV